MHPRHALLTLIAAVDRLTQALEQGASAIDAQDILAACQNFLETIQKFDELPPPGQLATDGGDPGLTPAELKTMREQLESARELILRAQRTIQDELGDIRRGRKGLRGYRTLEPFTREQFVSCSR